MITAFVFSPASTFLLETRNELLSFEKNVKNFQELIEFIEKKDTEKIVIISI